MSDFRIELSSKAFGKSDAPETLLERCRALCRERGVVFGVQLHNTTEHEEIKFFTDHEVPMSVHSPLEQPYDWNFAAADLVVPKGIPIQDVQLSDSLSCLTYYMLHPEDSVR